MTREEVVQCPDYWKALYEDECERLNIQPCLVFSKQEPINEEKLDELLMQLLICAQQGYTQCAPDDIVIRNMKKILKAKEEQQ